MMDQFDIMTNDLHGILVINYLINIEKLTWW